MFPAQAAASATALRDRRGKKIEEEVEGPAWEEILREFPSLFLARACFLFCVSVRGGSDVE